MNRVFSWPVGQGRFSLPVRYSLLYALAAIAGGASVGFLLACVVLAATSIPLALVRPAAASIAFVALAFQVTGRMGLFPERRAQVPRAWLRHHPSWFAVGFGAMIGFGALTWIRHAIAYAVVAALVVRGDPLLAIGAGGVFGAFRGLGPLVNRVLREERAAVGFERWVRASAFQQSRLVLATMGAVLLIQLMTFGG